MKDYLTVLIKVADFKVRQKYLSGDQILRDKSTEKDSSGRLKKQSLANFFLKKQFFSWSNFAIVQSYH